MLETWVVIVIAFAYLALLFAIAYYADQRADAGRSVINSPYIYSLSLAVYATAWTFYGSVGRAAENGVGFLPIYIGPTLMIALWWVVMRKILRISKQNRITSLADFIASRYGKSALLGGVVTVIAVIGILPYISLQLKAVSASFTTVAGAVPGLGDTALWVALILAAFTILFGTRHIDTAEHHEGMVAAVAFESLVKLLAFVAVGAWVTWGLYHGFGDIFARVAAEPALSPMLAPFGGVGGDYSSWIWLTMLSMLAIMFLPRQFQVTVIENKNEDHLRKAIWLFPLYMLAINVFVLPIAFGGLLHFPDGSVDADSFVLTLPMSQKQELLTL
ncbi:MAG TPA: histidine kinase, partial [Burkholderiales bacterium]|nr:histidine kinase [Burkholderiales bacterium]